MARRNQIEIEDDETPTRGREVDISEPRRKAKAQDDDEMFDPLDRNIVFPEDSAEDEDSDEDSDDEADEDSSEDSDEDDEDERDEDERRENRKSTESKRTMRERRLKEEAREEADALRESQKALEAEFAKLKAVVDSGATDKELDAKQNELQVLLDTLRTQKLAALEAGDSQKVIEIDDKIIDARSDLKMLEVKRIDAKKARDAAASAKPAAVVPDRHLTRWLRMHGKSYNGDPVFKSAADAVERLVSKDGFNPKTQEYYDEISKRLAKRFPEEFPDIRADGKSRRRRSPVETGGDEAPTQRNPRGAEAGGIKVRGKKAYLSPQNIKTMRAVGMDPTDPSDVRIFVRENVGSLRR